MLLANKGIIPSVEWYHDPNIKNKFGYTVEYYLKSRCKDVPNEWRTY